MTRRLPAHVAYTATRERRVYHQRQRLRREVVVVHTSGILWMGSALRLSDELGWGPRKRV